MTDLNNKILVDAAIEMMDEIQRVYGASAPESVTRSYTYETTNKSGKKVTKKVVRKYTNKKDTTNTLQNKTNKEAVIKNINEHFDKIMELAEHKRISYIKDNCVPKDITCSYNTLKSLWNKIVNDKNKIDVDNVREAEAFVNAVPETEELREA